MSSNPMTAGQTQCVSDAGVAVMAIGAPESWSGGQTPAPSWQAFHDTVERAIACWGHYDAEQIADMRVGVQRTQACWPCADQRVMTTGPCAAPLPSTVARNLAAGIDPNPPAWFHCGPPKPLSYWQQYAAGYATQLPAAQTIEAQSPWSSGSVGEAPVQPTETITGTSAPVVTLNPDGTTTVVQPGASSPSTPGVSAGAASPGATGSGASIPPTGTTTTSASAPGPFTSILSGLLAHPYLLIGGAVVVWFLFFRGKR